MSPLTIVSLIWCLSEIVLSQLLKSSKKDDKDQYSLKILWITIAFSVTVGVILGIKQIGFINNQSILLQQLGILLIIIGMIIRWIAILTLKKYFTVNVAVSQGQHIVTSGLYQYIRHPAYLGSLLSFLGLGIAFSNWLSIVFIFVPVSLAFFRRITIEEKVLIVSFGQEYLDYIKKTKRVLPGIY